MYTFSYTFTYHVWCSECISLLWIDLVHVSAVSMFIGFILLSGIHFVMIDMVTNFYNTHTFIMSLARIIDTTSQSGFMKCTWHLMLLWQEK